MGEHSSGMNAASLSFGLLVGSGGLFALALVQAPGCGGEVVGAPLTNSAANTPTNAVTNAIDNMPLANYATNVVVNAPTNGATNVAVNQPTNLATNVGETNVPISGGSYINDGVIHGHCFGFTIIEGIQTDCNVEAQLCCPYVLPGTSWDDIAMVGCNVNQPVGGGVGSEGTWTPTGTYGICIRGSGFQRIQIQGPNGAFDPNDRWCASVPAGGGCVPWQQFNTQCWDDSGNYYDLVPLQAVAALQPSLSDGVDVAITPVDGTLCISSIYVNEVM